MRMDDAEFYNLGLGDYFLDFINNGSGTGDLLELLLMFPLKSNQNLRTS